MGHLSTEFADGVATFTLAPPDGYMNQETVDELNKATIALVRDDSVRAVVLAGGVPGYFIRHYSVVELEGIARRLRERNASFDIDHPSPERDIDTLFDRLAALPQPVIAALNGSAMGGGFELALACDLRIAQAGDHAYGLPEVNIGILPGAGGTQRLARLIGRGRALEMILRGRTADPEEALALRMVHEVAPDAKARAIELARELAGKAPKAVAHIKRLIRWEAERPFSEALPLERTLFLDLLVSDDAIRLMTRMNHDDLDIREV